MRPLRRGIWMAAPALLTAVGGRAAVGVPPHVPLPRHRSISQTVVVPSRGPSRELSLAAIPLFFEQNVGQTASPVKFLSRTAGGTLFLTGTDAVMTLRRTSAVTSTLPFRHRLSAEQGAASSLTASLRLHLVGANPDPVVKGEDEQPGKSNYFIGNNPAKWRTGIANYRRVRFNGVYPGVDVVYYGVQHRLEHDFIVQPGASVSSIRLRIDGASRGITLDRAGNLVIRAAAGGITLGRPQVYQKTLGRRVRVDGRFVRRGSDEVAFAVGRYDHHRPLVIDPLIYSTLVGGTSGDDELNAIAIDSAGNTYIAGLTASRDFPTTPGAFQTVNQHGPYGGTAFVTKLNAAGTQLIYSTYLGGSDPSNTGSPANGIAVDSAGNAYVIGQTYAANFPTTPAAFQSVDPAPAGHETSFVTKIKPDGTGLVYSTFLSGSGQGSLGDEAAAVAVDGSGSAYVTGGAISPNFPVTPGAFQTINRSGNTPFIAKLNPNGSGLVYSTYLGGSGGPNASDDDTDAIALDSAGDVFVAGAAFSPDFPTTPGAFQTVIKAVRGGSAFITKLNPTGTGLIYSTFLGGSGDPNSGPFDSTDGAAALAVDASGSAYVAGYTKSTDFPTTPGAFQTVMVNPSYQTPYVVKLNASGTALIYSTYLSGSGKNYDSDAINALALDPYGHAFVTGGAYSTDFPTTSDAFQKVNRAGGISERNAFVTELNPNGTGLIYSTYLGGTQGSKGTAIAVDTASNVYAAGFTRATGFPTTSGAFQTASGSLDSVAFVTAFALGAPVIPPTVLHTFSGTGWQLISSPYTITQSFAALSISAFAYDTGTQAYVVTPTAPADTFHLGTGYWVYMKGTSVDIPGPGAGASSSLVAISLAPGWNLVGNPFPAAEPLSSMSVQDSSGAVTPYTTALPNHAVSPLFVYQGWNQSYADLVNDTDQIGAWEGAWVYAKQTGLKLLFGTPGLR